MAQIQLNNVTFHYPSTSESVLENVTITLDTKWKLGLIGRNGKGKTTLLKLLKDEYEYTGTIVKDVMLDYFPFSVDEKELVSSIIETIAPMAEEWQIKKELNLLKVEQDVLYRPFTTLSGGEKVKILLISLFLKDHHFLLLDEPTNHLDQESQEEIQSYLSQKDGFILVSHDRKLLDKVTDHILSINNKDIQITQGNYATFKENMDRQNQYESMQYEKLSKEIVKLEKASLETKNWSNEVEKSKYGQDAPDIGYIGHKSAKMMKRSKILEAREQKAIDGKKELLKNADRKDRLEVKPLTPEKRQLISVDKLQIYYDKPLFNPVTFELERGDRVAIIGKNGSGKTTLIECLMNKQEAKYLGTLRVSNSLKISYVSQDTSYLKGTLKEIAKEYEVEESVLKSLLTKMGVSQKELERDVSLYSEGQKKKVLIARSLSERAELYVWDEPLNYVDILSREQIEECIVKDKPTIIFVEHDETFIEKIATKKIVLT